MASYNHSHFNCNNTVTQFFNQSSSSLPDDLQNLMHFCVMGYESQANEKFSKPLVLIGFYIAIASLFHTVAMWADIINANKDMVPDKVFSFNAASITVLSIAMKLPLDMTGSMPGVLDQVAKLGGLAFMCTMMATLIPSLASMDNRDLVANIIGLAILVITIIGNISVEIYMGVIGDHMCSRFRTILVTMAFWYVALMLLLLLVSTSTAIIIPHTKKILELNYQERRNTLSEEEQRTTLSEEGQRTTLSEEELKRTVTRYWIMAKSGSPQFIMAGTYLALTSTLICVINAGLFFVLILGTFTHVDDMRSDYGSVIFIILMIQFVGIMTGTVALASRCVTCWTYRKSRTDPEGFSVSSLSERKRSCIVRSLSLSYRKSRTSVQRMNYFSMSLCIGLHIAVFALCRITGSLFERVYVLKSTTPNDESIEEKDLKKYVLYIEDSQEISQTDLKRLLNSMESLIQKAEKQQNGNFLELLQKSGLFVEGVNNFDIYHVPDLPSFKLNSWSLPIVTLICIAIHIPGISEDKIDKLIDAVDEALKYTHRVEESFKSANIHENLLNTAMTTVWYEVKENPNWFLNPMQICPHWEKKKPREILNWFKDRGNSVSQNMIPDAATTTYFQHLPDYTVIAAHSMQHISNQILLKNQNTIGGWENDQFFNVLCAMIADISFACLTNIPQVIMRKCHSDAIEKREESVEAAVKLLGRTTDIRKFLNDQADRLPIRDMDDPLKWTSIDWWHMHLGRPPVRSSLPSIRS